MNQVLVIAVVTIVVVVVIFVTSSQSSDQIKMLEHCIAWQWPCGNHDILMLAICHRELQRTNTQNIDYCFCSWHSFTLVTS